MLPGKPHFTRVSLHCSRVDLHGPKVSLHCFRVDLHCPKASLHCSGESPLLQGEPLRGYGGPLRIFCWKLFKKYQQKPEIFVNV
jgi:hypothetical protein